MTAVQANLTIALNGGGSKIIVDGEDITNTVRSVALTAAVGDVSTLTIEYACSHVEVEGEVVERHVCPRYGIQ